jgi:hypothetical protein
LPLPSIPTNEYNDQAYQVYQDAARHECTICKRKFLYESLQKHQKVCKPGGYFERHQVNFGTTGTTVNGTTKSNGNKKA